MSAARPFVLASASERRREILKKAGYAFELYDPGEVESAIASAPGPEALALARARAKAQYVAEQLKAPPEAGKRLVVGADTLVALGEEVLGKPLDRIDACRILGRLSGTRHRVITGVCFWLAPEASEPVLVADTSWVTLRPLKKEEIEAYVATGEADDKAGAYAIQETGDRFVARIEGSFNNVVGFPLEVFEELLPYVLKKWGLAESLGKRTFPSKD